MATGNTEQDQDRRTDPKGLHEAVVMYFLYKEGVYGHGVFWIGTNLEDGKREADKAASLDVDDYHEWNLYKFAAPTDYKCDSKHEKIYTGART